MRIVVAAFSALLLISAPAYAGRFAVLIANAAAVTKPATPGPAPITPVVPSGRCDNCDGRGKVGDGVTMTVCPVCNGTGKKTLTSPGGQWKWNEESSDWVPAVTSRVSAQRRGHYEERTVCRGGRLGCETIRVFVPD